MSQRRLSVPLGDGESPASFCSRLAFHACCDTVFEFCRDMGLSFRGVVDAEPDALALLAELGGTDVDALGRSAVRRNGSEYFCAEQVVSRPMLRLNRVRVCPACLADDLARNEHLGVAAAYGRSAWLLAPIRTCHLHSLSLIDVTDMVKGRKGLAMHDFAQRVGGVIRDLDKWTAIARPAASSQLETYILRRLREQPSEGARWLDTIPIHGVAQVCEMVGAVELGGPKANYRSLGEDQRREAGGAGYRLLALGPDGLRSLVDRLFREPPPGKGDVGLSTFLGQLYRWLVARKDPGFEPLRDIIREMAPNRLAMHPKETIFRQPVGERRVHSVQSASREFSIHPKRLRKLLRQAGFLDEASDAMTNHLAVFPADAKAADFLSKLRESMSLKEAGTYINAPRVQMRLLHDSGLITPFVRGRRGDEIKDHAFHRGDLDTFLSRLLADAADVYEGDEEFCDIPQAARRSRCHAADIVRMVLERRLSRVRRRSGIRGYLSVLVDPVEARVAAGLGDRAGLSLAEVHRDMGWSRQVAKALVDHGHLASKIMTNPITGLRQHVVEPVDLEQFDGEYISLFCLARQRGLTMSRLMEDLEHRGIYPVFDIDEVPARFFRRAELPSA